MILRGDFRPAWWLPGPHAQTIWPFLVRRTRKVATRPERLELPDGDFVDLDWLPPPGDNGPVVAIFPGLESTIHAQYVQGLMAALKDAGMGAVLMHYRGCSGTPNRLRRNYHSGDTGDIRHLLEVMQQRYPDRCRYAVGYSLGGNALLDYLAEDRDDSRIDAAAAASVPFVLGKAAHRINTGFSRFYQLRMLRKMKQNYRNKFGARDDGPVPLSRLDALNSILLFDNEITAPLHGFNDVHDYYSKAGCRTVLRNIRTRTLILHSRDDPFMTPGCVPAEEELSDAIRLEVTERGGHVGFVEGRIPLKAVYWMERRIARFLLQSTRRGQEQ